MSLKCDNLTFLDYVKMFIWLKMSIKIVSAMVNYL